MGAPGGPPGQDRDRGRPDVGRGHSVKVRVSELRQILVECHELVDGSMSGLIGEAQAEPTAIKRDPNPNSVVGAINEAIDLAELLKERLGTMRKHID